ncbi:Eukaryotic translation initiation factor 4 gamma 2 [Eumeta japonica]|uniref:Eukaryotic translation initiation factor 4 gamma 2 n=1 Tax=Eumeta variegata TaxID=151549 RepID=A0A4C1TLJ3_EUMVA|nr:Eukaryotic translation initiation factor 4 gamma 2 [Eumeta japonica]
MCCAISLTLFYSDSSIRPITPVSYDDQRQRWNLTNTVIPATRAFANNFTLQNQKYKTSTIEGVSSTGDTSIGGSNLKPAITANQNDTERFSDSFNNRGGAEANSPAGTVGKTFSTPVYILPITTATDAFNNLKNLLKIDKGSKPTNSGGSYNGNGGSKRVNEVTFWEALASGIGNNPSTSNGNPNNNTGGRGNSLINSNNDNSSGRSGNEGRGNFSNNYSSYNEGGRRNYQSHASQSDEGYIRNINSGSGSNYRSNQASRYENGNGQQRQYGSTNAGYNNYNNKSYGNRSAANDGNLNASNTNNYHSTQRDRGGDRERGRDDYGNNYRDYEDSPRGGGGGGRYNNSGGERGGYADHRDRSLNDNITPNNNRSLNNRSPIIRGGDNALGGQSISAPSSTVNSSSSSRGISPNSPALATASQHSTPAPTPPPSAGRWVPPSLRPQHGLSQAEKNDAIFRKLCKGYQKKLQHLKRIKTVRALLRLLIAVCRDKFNNRLKRDGAEGDSQFNKVHRPQQTATDNDADEEERRHLAKQRMLGNVKFIGELHKLDMLSKNVLHQCIMELLDKKKKRTASKEEMCEDMECLAQLLKTCGKNLDSEQGKELMNQYFETLERRSKSTDYPPRIRFMLKDVIELRENNWVPRKVVNTEGPVPIKQIRNDDEPLIRTPFTNRSRDMRNNRDDRDSDNWMNRLTIIQSGGLNDMFSGLSVTGSSPIISPSSNDRNNREERPHPRGNEQSGPQFNNSNQLNMNTREMAPTLC